jgi:hypothetical protein
MVSNYSDYSIIGTRTEAELVEAVPTFNVIGSAGFLLGTDCLNGTVYAATSTI